MFRFDFAGHALSVYLMKFLTWRDDSFATTAEHGIVSDSKETLAYMALCVNIKMTEASKSSDQGKTNELSDVPVIAVRSDRLCRPGVPFTPIFASKETSLFRGSIWSSLSTIQRMWISNGAEQTQDP